MNILATPSFFDNRVKIYVTTEISRPIRAKNRTGYP